MIFDLKRLLFGSFFTITPHPLPLRSISTRKTSNRYNFETNRSMSAVCRYANYSEYGIRQA